MLKKEILYCEHCGHEFLREDLTETIDGCFLCSDCLSEAEECCCCGELAYYTLLAENGNYYCGDCYDEEQPDLMPPYMELAHEHIEENM